MRLYEKLVLNSDSNKAGSEQAVKASRLFVKEMASLALGRRVDRWTVPPLLVSVETLPPHKMHLLGYVHSDATLIKRCPQVPLSQCFN